MDISIIISIYNVEEYIEQCLHSLFDQTKTDRVEFILIDDRSTDKSLSISKEIVNRYPHLEIIIIENQINQGIGTVRNTGISKIRGTYSIHVDGDDWCEPTMLEEMYNKAVETNAEVVGCDYYINDKQQQYNTENPLSENKIENIRNILDGRVHSSLCFKLIKRSLIIDNKIRLTRNFNLWEDLALSTKVFYYAEKVVYLPKSFYHYNRTNTNSITQDRRHSRVKDSAMAISEIDEFLVEDKILYREIKEILDIKKIRVKWALFRHLKGQEQKTYLKVWFPSIDGLILKSSVLKARQRIILYLATHNFLWLTNAMVGFYAKIRYGKRKI